MIDAAALALDRQGPGNSPPRAARSAETSRERSAREATEGDGLESIEGGLRDDLRALEREMARWFWDVWVRDAPPFSPLDIAWAWLLRRAMAQAGTLRRAADLVAATPATVSAHLDRYGDPEYVASIDDHPVTTLLARILERAPSGPRARSLRLRDRLYRTILGELQILCRGKKTEMAELIGWTPARLRRTMRRLNVGGGARVR